MKYFWNTVENYLLQSYKKKISVESSRQIYTANFLSSKKIKSVLDLGCSDGSLLQLLEKKSNINNLYGCDISSLFDKFLKNNNNKKIKLFKQNLNKSFKIKKRFDAITALSVFPYLKNWKKLLQALVKKNLTKNGLVIFSFPNALFDLYSSNALTLEFFKKYLFDKKLVKQRELKILNKIYSKKIKFEKNSAYSSKELIFKREILFEVIQYCKKLSLEPIDIKYFNYHPLVPFLLNSKKFLYRKKNSVSWEDLFTHSTFLCVMKKKSKVYPSFCNFY